MSSASVDRRPPAACTIVSRNFLSYARVLANSYALHEPGGRFYLLVVDGLPDGVEIDADVCLLGPEDLALPYFYDMCFEYDVAELCTAVKPSLLLLLFNRFGEEEVIFFDPDILILRALEELREPLASASIVLTPNLMKPLPMDGKRPVDQDILIAGAFNLGFIALHKSEQALAFLRWWEERLRNGGAVVYVPKGLMTDQKWVDLAPTLFPDTVIFRDDTYNVAWWNIHHREVSRRGEQFLVNGRPLTFYHFSGFDPANPRVFTKECENRTKLTEGTALADLFNLYVDLHMKNGFAETGKWQYRYARFDNGVVVNLPLRRLYLDLGAEARAQFGDPFRTAGANSFFDWATRPQPAEANLSPFLLSLYKVRFDLAVDFPDICGKHRGAFLEWARTSGARELGYDPEQMRIPDAAAAAGGRIDTAEVPKQIGGPFGVGADAGQDSHRGPATPDNWGAMATGVPPKHARHYQQVVYKIREVVRAVLPQDATVIVASKGDDELLELLRLDGRTAWHFPQAGDGEYLGYNPTDSAEAIASLETQRRRGGNFLLFPATALWWLDYYIEFKEHLQRHGSLIVNLSDTCLIFALGGPETEQPHPVGGVTAATLSPAAPDRQRGPQCSIVIPVHNKASLTRQCLDVLVKGPPEGVEAEIVVVDDASTDSTPQLLEGYGDRIRVVRHPTNLGFASACNDGAAVASGEYLVFLNNDTIPKAGWLDALVRYAESHPRAGLVGSKLLYPNETIQHAGVVFGQDRDPRHIYTGFPADHPAVNKSRRFQAVTGACALIRRALFKELGGFDTAFVNSYEDTDLCLRLGERGYEVRYCHESVLYHLESVTRRGRSKEDKSNARLYRQRWAHRVQVDELYYYVEDGLLMAHPPDLYPIQFSISPLLGLVNGKERDRCADRLLQVRTQQVFELLKDNIHLNVRVREAEFRASASNGAPPRAAAENRAANGGGR